MNKSNDDDDDDAPRPTLGHTDEQAALLNWC